MTSDDHQRLGEAQWTRSSDGSTDASIDDRSGDPAARSTLDPAAPPAPPRLPAAPLPDRTLTSEPDQRPGARGRRTTRPPIAPQPRDHERYDFLGEHGRGGLGRVSRAHDRELGRDIAIKELIARSHLGEVRFLREALITARLEHPGIVPVYEAGRWPDGTPFYAMKLVSGRPLRELIAERRTVDERLALLHHVIAVADAIAYAHGRSIIHRDLKPANVIVGEFGETVVIDWGLAKDLTAAEDAPIAGGPFRAGRDDGLTAAGTVLGTPAYMAPEQERGEAVDQRADVFAIGAMLWELCSLQRLPPDFPGHRRRLLRRSGIDHDLVAIIEKALDPDPARRYPEAGALAADLKAFKSGARIAARSYSLLGMLVHWTRRHRALAGSAVAAVAVAIGASTFYVRGVAIERDRADAALARVEATSDKLARERAAALAQRNELILSQATAALESDPTRAIEWLETYPADGARWDRVQVIAADAQSRGVARHILPSMSWTIAISPDGKTVMTAGPHDLVQIWDLASGRRLHELGFGGEIAAAAFAPDGQAIAIGGQGGEVVLWSPASSTRTPLGKLDSGARSVAFSPDGQRVLAASLHAIAAWDVKALRQVWSMPSAQAVTFLAVAPTGSTLAFGTADGTLHVSDSPPGVARQLRGHRGPITWISFSADGRSIATGGLDHAVRWWDPATGAGRLLGTHDGPVKEVRFSPDGALVASGGADQKLRVWSTTGGGDRVFSGHTDQVLGVMFAPDGQTLASVSSDRQVRLWDVASGDSRVLSGHLAEIGDVRFSPDGSLLVSSGLDRGTRVWSVAPPPSRTLGRHELLALHAVFSPDGRFVASAGLDRSARLWDLASGGERSLRGSGYTARALPTRVAFSTRGELLASVGDSAAHLWNVATGEGRVFAAPDALLRHVAITGDGSLLAAGDAAGRIRVWEVASNRVTVLAGHSDEVTALAFLPRGDRLVSAAMDGTLRIWDVSSSGSSEVVGTHSAAITRIAVSPAGDLVASGGRDGTLHLWNLAAHTDRALAGHTGGIEGLAFSRDGRRLASASLDATVRIWNTDTGEVRVLRGHDEDVRSVAFAPDDTMVASSGNDRTVRLWNLETGAIAILRGHRAVVCSVAFDAAGKRLVTASEDTTVRLWDLDRVTWTPQDRGELTRWLQALTTAALPPRLPPGQTDAGSSN